MTKKRLTPNQLEILKFCASNTHRDSSGSGYAPMYNPHALRTLTSLAKCGLVDEPTIYTPFSGAKITTKGWDALDKGWTQAALGESK